MELNRDLLHIMEMDGAFVRLLWRRTSFRVSDGRRTTAMRSGAGCERCIYIPGPTISPPSRIRTPFYISRR